MQGYQQNPPLQQIMILLNFQSLSIEFAHSNSGKTPEGCFFIYRVCSLLGRGRTRLGVVSGSGKGVY